MAEDDPLFALAIKAHLEKFGTVEHASTKEEAFRLLSIKKYDLVFADLYYGDSPDGLSIIQMAQRLGNYSVVLSGTDDDELTEKAYLNGCRDYIPKLHFKDNIDRVFEKYINQNKAASSNVLIKNSYITQDDETLEELESLKFLGRASKSIFISGPTGTGKGVIAKLIHELCGGVDDNFISVNCSAFNSQLLESELFGHEKGAFTGASSKKLGKLELADGGTLFLDEVATMPKELQVKLLKAVEERSFYRVGGEKKVVSGFRVISASWENIFDLLRSGEFRSDLYFRLSGYNIALKALRDRCGDIPLLMSHFMDCEGRKIVVRKEAMELLKNYPWPGNIRELKKLSQVLIHGKGGIISASDLPQYIQQGKNPFEVEEEKILGKVQFEYIKKHGLKKYVRELEKIVVDKVFQENEKKVRPTLKNLKISSTTFYRIVNSLEI